MRPPCEVVVRRVLPVLRALVAKELMDTYGLTQSETAGLLGVTQPAISTYISALEGDSKGLDAVGLESEAREIAAILATRKPGLKETVRRICALCIGLKSGGIVCTLHKEWVPELAEEACKVCLDLFGGRMRQVEERSEVLGDLKRAVALIEECDEFGAVMPQIRMNMVMAIPGAKAVSDVAGIPGRIIEVRGRARAFMEPEFGASYHLAKVLLYAMEVDDTVRAAANIKYDESTDRVLKELGLSVSAFEREALPRDVAEGEVVAALGVKRTANMLGGVPDVVVDKGGYGIEPASYVFGETAMEAAEKTIRIAMALAA